MFFHHHETLYVRFTSRNLRVIVDFKHKNRSCWVQITAMITCHSWSQIVMMAMRERAWNTTLNQRDSKLYANVFISDIQWSSDNQWSAMAEAAVQDTPIPRFFCHKCSVEIPRVLPVSRSTFTVCWSVAYNCDWNICVLVAIYSSWYKDAYFKHYSSWVLHFIYQKQITQL